MTNDTINSHLAPTCDELESLAEPTALKSDSVAVEILRKWPDYKLHRTDLETTRFKYEEET